MPTKDVISRHQAPGAEGPPVHGGDLRAASARFGIALEQWLDLSTGINPHAYPLTAPPASAWHRLPEDDDGLEAAARTFYGTEDLIAVAGTQMAIKCLPQLRAPARVLLAAPSYAEHAYAWSAAGHTVSARAPHLIDDQAVARSDVLVLVNPNNPDGHRYSATRLRHWRDMLAKRGGWLVVDEAFMETTPAQSLVQEHMPAGLIVLRSLGKFFGLAGARVGFVCAERALLDALSDAAGPWLVAGPSRDVATQALADRIWQRRARDWLEERSSVVGRLLTSYGLAPAASTAFFHWIPTTRAKSWQDALARRGVWTRRFEQPVALRIGLTRDDAAHARLREALAGAQAEVAAS